MTRFPRNLLVHTYVADRFAVNFRFVEKKTQKRVTYSNRGK